MKPFPISPYRSSNQYRTRRTVPRDGRMHARRLCCCARTVHTNAFDRALRVGVTNKVGRERRITNPIRWKRWRAMPLIRFCSDGEFFAENNCLKRGRTAAIASIERSAPSRRDERSKPVPSVSVQKLLGDRETRRHLLLTSGNSGPITRGLTSAIAGCPSTRHLRKVTLQRCTPTRNRPPHHDSRPEPKDGAKAGGEPLQHALRSGPRRSKACIARRPAPPLP